VFDALQEDARPLRPRTRDAGGRCTPGSGGWGADAALPANTRRVIERLEVARAIHDGVMPALCGVLVGLETGDVLDGERRRAYARDLADALARMRTILSEPSSGSAAEGTPPAPAEVLEGLADKLGDAVSVHAGPGWADRLPAASHALVEHFLSEAVNNATAHGGGGLEVRVRSAPATVTIEVTNDHAPRAGGNARRFGGRGAEGGIGLRLLSTHALQHGAVVAFGGGQSDRWQVRLVLPAGEAGMTGAPPPIPRVEVAR
jgi:signal transduction histidine kinase